VHVRVTNRPNRQQPATTTRGLGRNSDCIREREKDLLLLFVGWPLLVGVSVCVCPFCSFDSFYVHRSCGFFWCAVVGRSVGWLGPFVPLLLLSLSAVNNAIELNNVSIQTTRLALFLFSFFLLLFWLLWLWSVRYGCPLHHCLMFRLMTGQSSHTASACQQSNSPGFKRSDLTAHTHQHPKKKLFKSRGCAEWRH
jgi:hypothetical protein